MNKTFNGNVTSIREQVNAAELTDAAKAFILSNIADGEEQLSVHVTSFHATDEAGQVCASTTVTVHKQ